MVKKRARGDFERRLSEGKTKACGIGRRRGPLNLVSCSPWSAKNSSQNLGYVVNPVNADERKGVETAAGKPLQIASKSEVGYSQVSRQENALKAQGNLCVEQLQKQHHQRAHSNSQQLRAVCAGAQLQTNIFQFLQKKLGFTAGYSTISMQAFKKQMC